MLLLLPLTILISQGLVGSAYVVLEENGYYSTWRSNPMQNQWPGFLSPQMYMPFFQNFNPFSWNQPQPPVQQENRELRTIRVRQNAIFNMLRCVIEENEKDTCRKILDRTMILFEEPQMIFETVASKPIVIESTIWKVKPMQAAPAELPVKPMDETPVTQEKPVQDVQPPVLVVKPVEVEVSEEQIKPVETGPMMEINPVEVLEVKPMEVNPVEVLEVKPMEVLELSAAPEMVPSPVEQAQPMPVESPVPVAQMAEVEPVVSQENPLKDSVVLQEQPANIEPVVPQEKPVEVEPMLPQEEQVVKTEPMEPQLETTDTGRPVLRIELENVPENNPVVVEPSNIVQA